MTNKELIEAIKAEKMIAIKGLSKMNAGQLEAIRTALFKNPWGVTTAPAEAQRENLLVSCPIMPQDVDWTWTPAAIEEMKKDPGKTIERQTATDGGLEPDTDTDTTNTTTEGAKTMKKENTTTTAQAQQTTTQASPIGLSKDAPKAAPKKDSKSTAKQSAPKADSKTKKADKTPDASAPGFKPKFNEDKPETLFSVPRISGEKYAAPDGVVRTEYTTTAKGRETAFCRNSIKSQELADLVQLAIVKAELDKVASTISALADKIDKETDGARKAALKAERDSATKAKTALSKKYPGAASFVPAKDYHAALIAAGVRGEAVPVDTKSWVSVMASASSIMTSALLDKFAGKGSAAFTQEERETMTELKDATSSLFAAYCTAGKHNKSFNLRVKDSDIVTWYQMSAAGFKGERDKYTTKTREKWERELTTWFLGKIYKEHEDPAQTPAK